MASAFGDLVIKLGLNTVEYREGLDRAQFLTAQFSAGAAAKIAAVGTLAVQATQTALSAIGSAISAVPNQVRDTVDRLDKLGESATRLGVSAEFLQAFNYQLQLAGTSSEAGEKGIQKFQQQLTRARAGAEDAGKLFRALGVDVKQFGANSEEALAATIDRIAKLNDPAIRNTFSRELLGKAGAGVAAAFDEGAASIAKAREELSAFGALASGDLVAQAGALSDNLDKMKVAGTAFGLAITEAVTPALLALTAEFVESKKGPSALRDEIRGLTRQSDAILEFAQSSIVALAKFADFVVLTAKGIYSIVEASVAAGQALFRFGQVIGEIGRIGADLLTAPFAELPGRIARSVQQIKAFSAEAGAIIARADLSIADRLAGSSTPVSDLLNRTVLPVIEGARRRLREGNLPAVARRPGVADDEALNAFRPKSPEVKDGIEAEIRALEKQAVQLQFTAREFTTYRGLAQAAAAAGIDFELSVGKFSDKVRAEGGLAPIKPDDIERIKKARDGILEFGQSIERLKATQAIADSIKLIEIETESLRKGNVEREKARELEKLRKVGVSPTDPAFTQAGQDLDDALRRRERTRGLIQSEEFGRNLDDQVAALRLETQVLGLNEAALRDLTEARRLDLEVRNATRNADNTLRVEPEVERAFIDRAQEARRALDAANRDRIEAERSARVGVQTFARDYIENASNAARQAQQFLSTVASSLEDQIVKVFRDGKLDVKAFFDTIAEEALRLTARNLIGDLFKAGGLDRAAGGSGALSGTSILGSVGGLLSAGASAFTPAKPVQTDAADNVQGGTVAGSLSAVTTALRAIVGLFGGSFAIGGDLAAGKWGIVGERGPELAFAPAGGMQIFPQVPVAAMGGGGQPVQVTNNFTVQGQVDRATQQQIAARVYRATQDASRRNN